MPSPLESVPGAAQPKPNVRKTLPDGQSALNLAAARLRHIAGTAWSTKRYLNIELLKDQQMRGDVLSLLAGNRAAIFLPRRRCGGGAGKSRARGGVPRCHSAFVRCPTSRTAHVRRLDHRGEQVRLARFSVNIEMAICLAHKVFMSLDNPFLQTRAANPLSVREINYVDA